MTRLRKVSLLPRVFKSSVAASEPYAKLETLLGQPKANQALKRCLETNANTRAMPLFKDLWRQSPAAVDSYSLLFSLKACIRNSLLVEGRQLHAVVKKMGCEPIIFIQTCLIDLYAIMGDVDCAHHMFDEIPCKNTICWTTLISAYIDNDMPSEAVNLFKQMLMNNIKPDQITLTVALTACANLGALSMGQWIHAYICRKGGSKSDICLNNALINMYVKCGEIRAAKRLFYSFRHKDVFTWTAMIVGLALHGQSLEALNLFAEMKKTRNVKDRKSIVIPNDVTFLGVLMACSHAGMVEEGRYHFKSMMQNFGLWPRPSHIGCMVDLLCRAGLLEEAYNFILEILVQPTAVVWRTLLGACFLCDNIELGAKVRLQLLELEPTHVGDDVVLSNMYAAKGFWHEKMLVRDHIECRRTPGCSSIEVGTEINEFVAGDSHHPLKTEIYDVLGHLMRVARAYCLVSELFDVMDY